MKNRGSREPEEASLRETLEGRGNEGGVDEDVAGILNEGEQKYHSCKRNGELEGPQGGEKGASWLSQT